MTLLVPWLLPTPFVHKNITSYKMEGTKQEEILTNTITQRKSLFKMCHLLKVILNHTKIRFFLIFILCWTIVDLQCCISFRHTAKRFSFTYTYVAFHFLFHYKLLQSINSFQGYTVGFHVTQ